MGRRVLFFLLLLVNHTTYAQLPDGRNHPELLWRTRSTPHFDVIFHQGLDSLAVEAGRIAESLYGPITQDLGIEPRGRTPLILSDVDDLSNGIANPLDHTIFIYTKSENKATTGTLRWLRDVIGHEFAHIVTFWRSRNFLGKPWELMTLGLTPTWFIEGVAQYEAEFWDDHRNLLLRTAVMDSALLTPRKLDGYVGADQVDARLVYEEGHGLVRHLASAYGRESVKDLLDRHRRFPFSFSWSMKRTVGKPTGQLFREWKTGIEGTYHLKSHSVPAHPSLRNLTIPLQVVTGVRPSPDGDMLAVVGMERWDEGIQRLYTMEEDGSRFRELAGPYVGSYFSWSPDGKRLVYSRKRRGKHGSLVDDLFIVGVDTKEKRLTTNARSLDPVWSPVKDTICYVKAVSGGSQLRLLDLNSDRDEILFDPGIGREVFSPNWSPDGDRIAFSLYDEKGWRDIAVLDRNGKGFHRLTNDAIDDRTPVWSPDGERIAFCSYGEGTPDIVRMQTDGSDRQRLTGDDDGFFNPVWTSDGESIVAVVFESRNRVSAVEIPVDELSDTNLKAPRPAWSDGEPFEKVIDPASIGFSETKRYRSLSRIRPHLVLPFFGEDDAGMQFGLIGFASDPLYKHQLLGSLTVRERVDWNVNYSNAELEPVIDVITWGSTRDRGIYLIKDGPRLWERRLGGRLQATLPINFGKTLLSNHAISFWFETERIRVLHSDRFEEFKVYYHPFEGWKNVSGLGYRWAWQRPTTGFGVHPVTGAFFQSTLEGGNRRIGSDVRAMRFTAYGLWRQELPWARHVTAFSLGCLFQGGETPIQDWISLTSTSVPRGISSSRVGDRFLYGSAEYRIPLIKDLGFRIPILYFEQFAFSLWVDWDVSWGRTLQTYETEDRLTFSSRTWLASAGAEIRCRLYLWGKLPVLIRGGYGRDILHETGGRFYWLIGPLLYEWQSWNFRRH